MEILRLEDVGFQYGSKKVLDNIHLSIEKGEQVSLLGLSGSGKTTLLRLCAGFEKPSRGEIFLRKQKVASKGSFVRCRERKVGFVFQDYALFPHLTVAQNIEYGCESEKSHSKAQELIELLNLNEHLHKKPESLSGGEKQKVALVRTLCLEPDIIFLDEPFSSIDSQQTQFLVKELRGLFQKLGVTSLMVTHSQYEAMDFSDRVFVLNEGCLLQSGTPGELYSQPESSFVADFFGKANWLVGRAQGLEVQTELGSFPLSQAVANENCQVLLRPEELSLNDKGEGLECEVVGQSYRFDRWLVDVKTPEGQNLVVISSVGWSSKSKTFLQRVSSEKVIAF